MRGYSMTANHVDHAIATFPGDRGGGTNCARRLVGFQWWRQSTTQRLNRGCQRNPPRQTTGAGATTTGAAGATTTGAAGATTTGAAGATTTGPSLGRHLP